MIEKTSKKLERTIQNSKILYLGCFLFLLLGLFTAKSVSAIANQISFQGKLTDSSGSLVTDGTYYLKFSIYDASSGGTCQYTAAGSCGSATTTPVTLTSGIFSVNLGDTDNGINALASNLFNADVLYLGITVCSGPNTGCDAEMTPRKRITAAPYAFNADRLSGLTTSTQGGNSSYIPATDVSGNLSLSNSLFLATSTAGQLGVGTSTVPTGYKAYLESTTAADKLLVIRANASQAGNLTEWQNSSGVSLLSVDPAGNISTSGTLSIFGDLNRINNVAYTWPSSQGGANTYLKNDGSGGLTWATVAGGSSINDWGRFGETYGVSALMTSTSYPVWFDNIVAASSSVLIAGAEAHLDIGAPGNGLSQLFVQASSSEAVPLVIRGPAGGTGNTDDLFFAIQNSSGNNILSFSTSTRSIMFPIGHSTDLEQSAVLSIGDVNHLGGVIVNSGFLVNDYNNSYVESLFSAGRWMVSSDGVSTSSLFAGISENDAGLILFAQDNYDSGTFHIDPSGDISTSGTLAVYGGEIFVQSAESTDNPLVIRSNSTQTGNLTEWQDSLGNKLGSVASTTIAIDGFSDLGLVLSLGNNYEESDPSFSRGGLAIDGDNFYDANTFILHDTIFLTADAGNSSIFNSHYLSLGKASSTDRSAGLIYLDGDDGIISASNTIQNFVVSGGGSDDYWQKWLDSSGSVRASLTSSTGSYISPNTNNVSYSDVSLLVLGASQHTGVLYLTDNGSILLGDRGIVTGELKRSELFLSDPFDDEVTATTTYGYKEIVFVQDENYDQGYFHMDDSGNISTSGSIRLFGDLGSPSYNTGLSLFSVSDDGSVVTNTLQSFVGDVAGSTGFAFDTVASGGAMTSGTTDRMLAVFQNNGTNKVSISAGGNVYAANSFIANSTDYGIGDVAEYVNLANGASAEAGDVLVIDTTGSNVYKKSDSAYAKNVAGVVSDTGKFVMGASGLNRAPLALAGLVKVKVTNENGAINPGDYLITASKPGYAMKYDPANSLSAAGLVGMALESLIDTEGKITILVNKGLVAGASNNVTMSVDGSGQLISNNNLDLAGGGITNVGSIAAASGLWQIDSEGKLIAKSITADKIQTKELVLAKDQTQESTIGEATILSGQQNVEVLNTKIKKNSKIFVTFRGNPGSFWWIGNQEDGKFSVFLSSNAAQDITFDYWLVTIDEEDTTASVGTEVIPGANNTNPFTNLPPIGSTSGSDSSNDGGTAENSESNSTETAGNSTSGEADTTTNTNAATDESSSAATNNENSSSSSGNTEASTDNSTNSETADTLPSSETTTETAS